MGFEVCFLPYFLTVEDENRERKQKSLAQRSKREEELGSLVRKVKVLPEVCFHVHWSWIACCDGWRVFSLHNCDIMEEKFLTNFCTASCKSIRTTNTWVLGCFCTEIKIQNDVAGLGLFLEVLLCISIIIVFLVIRVWRKNQINYQDIAEDFFSFLLLLFSFQQHYSRASFLGTSLARVPLVCKVVLQVKCPQKYLYFKILNGQ